MGEDESEAGGAAGNRAASESKIAGAPEESVEEDAYTLAGLTCRSVEAAAWLDDFACADASVGSLRGGNDEVEEDREFAVPLLDFEDGRDGVN